MANQRIGALALLVAGASIVMLAAAAACGGSTTSPTPTGGFQIASAAVSVDSSAFTGACPHLFTFTGTLTASAGGTATYRWERSDSTYGPTESVTFTQAGSQLASTTWNVGSGTSGGWVRIHVLGPNDLMSNQAGFSLTCTAPPFTVTGLSSTVDQAVFAGTCPRKFTFTGAITASGPGTVTYQWERSDGTRSPVGTLTFEAAGQSTQSISDQWELQATLASGWAQLHILTPNDITSNRVAITLTCTQ